jgi:hypothetical protein
MAGLVLARQVRQLSKLGTCAFCLSISEAWMPPRHPHQRAEFVPVPEFHICRFLDCFDSEPPPPIRRHRDCFVIEEEDCNRCPHFVPAGVEPLEKFVRARKRRVSRQRAKAKAATKESS